MQSEEGAGGAGSVPSRWDPWVLRVQSFEFGPKIAVKAGASLRRANG